MACPAVELITDYLEDALAARQRADVEQHLTLCPHAAAHVAEPRITVAATGHVDAGDLSSLMCQTLIERHWHSRQ
jgi:anti-sigma factor RsiW